MGIVGRPKVAFDCQYCLHFLKSQDFKAVTTDFYSVPSVGFWARNFGIVAFKAFKDKFKAFSATAGASLLSAFALSDWLKGLVGSNDFGCPFGSVAFDGRAHWRLLWLFGFDFKG
jgi:hypothetical protein